MTMVIGLPDDTDEESRDMGKKKAISGKSTKQLTLISIKGTEEYGEWLKGLAKHIGLPVTHVYDMAIKSYAIQSGYFKVPPSRLKR